MATARPESQARVICVDDDPITRSLIKAKIQHLTMDFVEAEDGFAAWNLIRKGVFDIAFIDLEMPNLDGFDLLRCVRGAAETKHMPVVVISSRDDSGTIRSVFEAGASSFLSKPVQWTMFEPLVSHLLRMASAVRELESQAAGGVGASTAEPGPMLGLGQLTSDLEQIHQVAQATADLGEAEVMQRRLREIAIFASALARQINEERVAAERGEPGRLNCA